MAKAQLVARFSVEVAPPPLSSIIRPRRRGFPAMLDTIAEEEPDAPAPAIVMAELSSYALLRGVAAAAAVAVAPAPPPPPRNVMVGSSCSSLVLVRAEAKEKRCVVVVVGSSASAAAAVHGEKRLHLAAAPASKAAVCSKIGA
uniref:Uncharacterized protein n=1 Tax=Oryza punctata TaxID=4537 RepID=A0A0E0KVF5_ORYPU